MTDEVDRAAWSEDMTEVRSTASRLVDAFGDDLDDADAVMEAIDRRLDGLDATGRDVEDPATTAAVFVANEAGSTVPRDECLDRAAEDTEPSTAAVAEAEGAYMDAVGATGSRVPTRTAEDPDGESGPERDY